MKNRRAFILVMGLLVLLIIMVSVRVASENFTPPPRPARSLLTYHKPIQKSESVSKAPVVESAPKQTVNPPPPPAPAAGTHAGENREKLHSFIDGIATTYGMKDKLLQTQWICIDKLVTAEGISYDSYYSVFNSPVVQRYIQHFVSQGGVEGYRYFDGPGSCTLRSNPQY